jgi:hypothetical protein
MNSMLGEKPARRAATVMETMERILDILKNRNQHEFLEALLQDVDLKHLYNIKHVETFLDGMLICLSP